MEAMSEAEAALLMALWGVTAEEAPVYARQVKTAIAALHDAGFSVVKRAPTQDEQKQPRHPGTGPGGGAGR